MPINKYFYNVSKYTLEYTELLTKSATIALINNKIPLEASNLKNHLNAEEI